MKPLAHLSLFSGIGGLDLAAEAAGFTTVGQCEWADYPTKVLEKHWPDVPQWRDIRTLTGSDFYERTSLRTVDIISGGFPCQPFSVAGKRRGKDDDRYLWPEMLRVISEIRPSWVIGENVPGIVNMALDQVLSDLEGQGYACQTFNIPACGVDAPHKRARIAIVGCNADTHGLCKWEEPEIQSGPDTIARGICTDVADTESQQLNGKMYSRRRGFGFTDSGENVPDAHRAGREKFNTPGEPKESGQYPRILNSNNVSNADSFRCSARRPEQPRKQGRCEIADDCGALPDTNDRRGPMWWDGKFPATPITQIGRRDLGRRTPEYVAGQWWPTEPDVGRVANGIPSRVDRLKCLGNAVVPQQFYPFFKYIAEIEGEE